MMIITKSQGVFKDVSDIPFAEKTPRMLWGFFRIRKDRHLLRVVHPTAREKKKHHRWKRCTGWHLSEVFWPHSQPGLNHSADSALHRKKKNKGREKIMGNSYFFFITPEKTSQKKHTPCFLLDPLLIGGKFKFSKRNNQSKNPRAFLLWMWGHEALFLDIFRHIGSHCFGGAILGVTLVRIGYPPKVQQEVRPLKRYLLKKRNWKKKTSSSNFQSHHFSGAVPVKLRGCTQKNTIYTSFFWGGGPTSPGLKQLRNAWLLSIITKKKMGGRLIQRSLTFETWHDMTIVTYTKDTSGAPYVWFSRDKEKENQNSESVSVATPILRTG